MAGGVIGSATGIVGDLRARPPLAEFGNPDQFCYEHDCMALGALIGMGAGGIVGLLYYLAAGKDPIKSESTTGIFRLTPYGRSGLGVSVGFRLR